MNKETFFTANNNFFGKQHESHLIHYFSYFMINIFPISLLQSPFQTEIKIAIVNKDYFWKNIYFFFFNYCRTLNFFSIFTTNYNIHFVSINKTMKFNWNRFYVMFLTSDSKSVKSLEKLSPCVVGRSCIVKIDMQASR